MSYRCAILDDYQNTALKLADWSQVTGDVEVTVFNNGLGDLNAVAEALKGFQIVCAGLDGKYGPATPRLVVVPTLETYDDADGFQRPHPADKTERDNLTNLSSRPLGEAAK